MEDSIPKLDIRVDNDRIREGALQVVRIIRPDWPEQRLHCKIFTDGITNRLVGVYRERDRHDMLLIRIYGENTDLFIDRQIEYRNMRTMYKAGLSPPIYCTFLNGISYGYSPGSVLDEKMVRDRQISSLIAENMARMHTLKPLMTNAGQQPSTACLFAGVKKFLVLINSALPPGNSNNTKR